jgi:hypothetical protein
MMFQRRPFISQREKTLALRNADQSRHRRDHEEARTHWPTKPDAFEHAQKPQGAGRWQSDIR